MSLITGTRLGRYKIRSQLGAGGMGEVYLAQDTKLDRKVALKILPAEVAADRNRMNRFVQEAKAASALNHPNIITIYEIEQIDSVNFIATEFIDGETLRERIRKASMKLGEVLDVAIQAASALAAAQAAGIIHRDIKPENVMLRRDGIVKLLDFGLAKLTEQPVATSVDTEAPTRALMNTEPGMVMGTATYMSPEQARGLDVDARTDIFSLGALIYEMVAGRLPFDGSNQNEIVASILSDKETAPLARYAQAVPVELERIVAKALRKRRDERYQTVKDLLLDLKALKQELEFEAKLERSAPPKARVSLATASRGQSGATIDQSVASTVQVSQAHPTSSAEYLVAGIKQHKVAAIVVLIVVAVGIVGLAAYLHARNTEVAIASIAVLPFANQNHDPDSEYLSDGLTESIINSLTQISNLKVIARSSVFRYKGKQTDPIAVANELGVRAVLTGRIMQRGENLTVSAELIDARDNKQLWGERYERKVSDLLSVQRDIAQEISGNLRLRLSGAEQNRVARQHTENAEAYQLYLQGRFQWYKQTEDGLTKAIEYFEQAVGKDPNYALAHTGLADSYWALADASLSVLEAIPKAKDEATKALQLDDSLAEAHTSLAVIKVNFEFDWAGAENEFKRAIELNPNYAEAHHQYGWLLAESGRPAEGLEEMKRAQRLDPLNLVINVDINAPLYFQRRFDLSVEQSRKVVAMDPNFYLAHYTLGWASLQLHDFKTGIAELEKARALEDKPWIVGTLAYGYALSGNRTAALKLIAELHEQAKHRHVTPYWLAMTSIALGDKDDAFKWLEQSYEERSFWLIFLKMDAAVDPLRDDPRFKDLLKRLRFPE
ncbi:MAG TPA: protein kinase [Pyrinomonadaceae bacterium]|nr:protein kinase [Pyrinomonadaceae bacterium]